MDASEIPLQQSVERKLRDWTAMLPESASDVALEAADKAETTRSFSPPTAPPEDIFSPDRFTAQVPSTLVDTSIAAPSDGGAEYATSERSSSSTFLSADDGNVRRLTKCHSPPVTNGYTADNRQYSSRHHMAGEGYDDTSYLSDRQTEYPSRDASLQAQHTLGFVAAPNLERKYSTLAPGTLSSVADSRPHSPSPASFSRPRPSSISYGRGLPSPNTTAANAAKVLRAQKTASRIPIPDPKKAMLVDVKARTSAATQKSDHAPSFGSRRLDAPDTLKILDQGIKRRQMNQPKRTNTERSTATTETSSTQTYGHNEIPHIDRSKTNTPDDTFGTSSSDEEEIATPTYQVGFGSNVGLHDKAPGGHTNSYYHSAAVRLFDGAVSALGRTPPPTSPYTDPLQTIPSQGVLPVDDGTDAPLAPTHSRKPSDLNTLNRRLSDLHSAHADYTAPRIGDRARVPESTKYSLLDLLNEYTNKDHHLSKDGYGVLGAETKKHITRTLSMLEGNGSPPHTDVDNETLLRLFGHLKRGLERQPESVSLVNNAAAAEQFLAQANDGETEVRDVGGNILGTQSTEADHEESQADTNPHLPPIETVASKWSESTGSIQALSPVSSQLSPRQMQSTTKTDQLNGPPQRSPPDPPRSIGYPSRLSSKASALIGPGGSGAATPPVPFRRLSSPTLGKRKPGSVRAARETMHHMKGGFAGTTASAESKKSSRMPTSNIRPLQLPDSGQRGRVPSTEKARSQAEAPGVLKTRSRSKSRYVLDKINGLFSTKRDKRDSAMPPVPSMAELDATPERNVESMIASSPILRPMRGPPGAKMPTMSPPIEHPALPAVSRLDTPTSADSPVDSVTAADDNNNNKQALQTWAATLVSKAARERDPARKERLVAFAKVLNDSLISAREAQISAETAQHAARSAQLSYEMTQKSVAMLQRLAASLIVRGGRR
ncbi:hypothetical protein B0A55_09899 [Friedmanniomyces simplex]|uniref:Uncharacterized protein n=1 Tax=Friedmanniomyces simplex TaxID=329884 RepID=A0A4U0WQD7_9PEZI|nr:hypothetical protein B0A55_09899 [Friedmanniomyces simplex]